MLLWNIRRKERALREIQTENAVLQVGADRLKSSKFPKYRIKNPAMIFPVHFFR